MCTSPLIRYRAKRQDAGTFLASSSNWIIKSAKELESYFTSYSGFRSYMDKYMDYQYIPCRKCNECKSKYAQEWSIRCYHEFQVRECGSFITLTIDTAKVKNFFEESNLKRYCNRCVKGNRYIQYPIDYTLCKGLVLDWLKKFRDYLYKKYDVSIRYFGCGEYGELDERPHYHILIFGYNFPDKKFYKNSDKGVPIYLSEELYKSWNYGICTVQDVNHQACMYTAKYVMKKMSYVNEQDFVENYYGREPEFLFMSKGNCQSNRCPFIYDIIKNCKGIKSLRDMNNPYCKNCNKTRGGLGYDWFLKYKDDVLKKGFITIEGIKYKIPNYYLKILELTDKEKYDKYKIESRMLSEERFLEHPEELSSNRLSVKAQCIKGKLKHYHRE